MDMRVARHPPAEFAVITSDKWTAPFWEAVSRRELCLPRCGDCGTYRMPPTPFCPNCQSQNLVWPRYEGSAVLYSYTIVDRAIVPGMEASLPYVPAIVELPEAQGVRLITNMVDCAIGALEVGQSVKLVWIEHEENRVLPAFILEEPVAGVSLK